MTESRAVGEPLSPPSRDAQPQAKLTGERPERALRRLFLTVFLRGRSARGLTKRNVPTSVPRKLALTLVFYALVGLLALYWRHQSVLVLSTCLHALTFVFLGTFVAASAGELLFNRQEADILLHRPVTPRALLWAKMAMLVQVSLWIALAFNLVGFYVGYLASDASLSFPLVHLVSTCLVAALCTGSVVLVYELCLRWFGRERLDGLITFAQVLLAVAAMLLGQAPRFLMNSQGVELHLDSFWMALLPPVWFAGLDDAVAGRGTLASFCLGGVGVAATALVFWLALGRLAVDYQEGLRNLDVRRPDESGGRLRRRFLHALVNRAPLSWALRDPVARSSFLLSLAYLARNRDTKLRVYPGVIPICVLPLILFTRGPGQWGGSAFSVAFSGTYVGLVPMLTLELLQYSQDHAASELFRRVPIEGPSRLVNGARWAVLTFSTLPLFALIALFTWITEDVGHLLLLLPGLIALPLYTLVPCLGGRGVPLSQPGESAKSAGRGMFVFGSAMVSLALAGTSAWAYAGGWFAWLLSGEALLALGSYLLLSARVRRARWPSDE
jgi:ABC-2 type transport system permease protein